MSDRAQVFDEMREINDRIRENNRLLYEACVAAEIRAERLNVEADRLRAQRDSLLTALNSVLNTVVDANLCPFRVALVRREQNSCNCNYHAATRNARKVVAKVEAAP